MKVKTFLRLGKTNRGVKVVASGKVNHHPLEDGGYRPEALPTVMFAIVLDLPDDIFQQAEKVIGEINIGKKKVQVAAVIPEMEIVKE